MGDLLNMIVHLADENAREVRERRWSHGTVSGSVTLALVEDSEWAAFVARLTKRRELLRVSGERLDDGFAVDDLDLDEDDLDILLALAGVLVEASNPRRRPRGLTLSEVVVALQRERVLSLEFAGPARAQAKRMLSVLRQMNKVWVDDDGRWSLL